VSTDTVRYIISVLTPDRLGIIAEVASEVYELGGNCVAMSQTIAQGWFTMVLLADFPSAVTREEVRTCIGRVKDFEVIVCPHDQAGGGPTGAVVGEPFVVTIVGEDKPGIVKRIARSFAKRRINIDDVWNEVRDGQFIVIFHVTMPPDVDAKEVRHELNAVGESLGVSVMLQHQDIFTATNSLVVHTKD